LEQLIMPTSNLAQVPQPRSLLAQESALTIAARTCLLEGPAFDGDGNLFFSDIIGNLVYRMAPNGAISIFRADSGRTNGNTFDVRGLLISCEGAEFGPGGRRRVVRTELKTGHVEVLTDRFEGKRYNSPNDVVVDVLGRIWFTDPFYGDDRGMLELDAEAVYRIDRDGRVTRAVSQPQIERPNGLAITPDSRTLYVIDSHTRPGGNRKVWSFHVDENGGARAQTLVYDFGRGRGGDGMRLDERGNLWIAAGILHPRHAGETADVPAGVYVISPQGELLGRIPIPEDVCTNLTFGGPERKTLFVTAGKTIFKIALAVSGYSLYPPVPI
jgi:gluconolactonase